MKKYKLAVDLGTTNVEFAVLENNLVIASESFPNPQYGRDVINRILVCTRDKKQTGVLKSMFINELIKHVSNSLKQTINTLSWEKMCICGNTTMISILLNYDIEELGAYPFNHKLSKSIVADSAYLFGGDFPIKCPVILSGCASAFIGGDVLAGLVFTCKNELFNNTATDNNHNSNTLFMDLGTNGELVLISNGKCYATSAACGPVFEGCARRVNVYGSTVIDAISLCIKSGRIDRNNPWDNQDVESGLMVMGVEIDAVLLQEIAMAKAAIYTGIQYLFEEAGIGLDDVSKVYIAGGFGFHLNLENAFYIGLIPKEFDGKIKVVGNTSLKGAIKLMESVNNLEIFDGLTSDSEKINVIQTANKPDYQDKLIGNINFN